VQPDVRRDRRAANLLAERLQEDEEKPIVPPWSCRALDSPGPAIVHFVEGPGASDKVSDNGSRHRLKMSAPAGIAPAASPDLWPRGVRGAVLVEWMLPGGHGSADPGLGMNRAPDRL
jgi:hypothetical protein